MNATVHNRNVTQHNGAQRSARFEFKLNMKMRNEFKNNIQDDLPHDGYNAEIFVKE